MKTLKSILFTATIAVLTYSCSKDESVRTPVSVTITKIVLTDYPMTDGSGAGWDYTDGPDIFISINKGNTPSDIQTSGIISDVTGNSKTFSSNNIPFNISSLSENWAIGLWDYDSFDPNDFMGGILFNPNNYKTTAPTTIDLPTASISMTLYVTWNY